MYARLNPRRSLAGFFALLMVLAALPCGAMAASAEAGTPYDGISLFGATGGNLQNGAIWNLTGELYGLFAPDGKIGLYTKGADSQYTALAEGYATQVNVLDGIVYYLSLSNPRNETGCIYSVPADGSEKPRKLSDDKALFLLAAGDTLYYTLAGSGHLYAMKNDGSGRRLLLKNNCGLPGGSENAVYFQNKTKKSLCILDLATGEITSVRLNYSGFGQFEDGVFYYRDAKKHLSSCKADGSENRILFNGSVDGLNVGDGIIYFVNRSDKGYPYSIKTDGTGLKKLAEVQVDFIISAGGTLYLISKRKQAFYTLDGAGQLAKLQ